LNIQPVVRGATLDPDLFVNPLEEIYMSNSKMLASAALAGLLSIGVVGASVAQTAEQGNKMEKPSTTEKSSSADKKAEKHACKGHNSCKGQGGDGKNACKGKGSCATDGGKSAK
jgi:hypothetical protein